MLYKKKIVRKNQSHLERKAQLKVRRRKTSTSRLVALYLTLKTFSKNLIKGLQPQGIPMWFKSVNLLLQSNRIKKMLLMSSAQLYFLSLSNKKVL